MVYGSGTQSAVWSPWPSHLFHPLQLVLGSAPAWSCTLFISVDMSSMTRLSQQKKYCCPWHSSTNYLPDQRPALWVAVDERLDTNNQTDQWATGIRISLRGEKGRELEERNRVARSPSFLRSWEHPKDLWVEEDSWGLRMGMEEWGRRESSCEVVRRKTLACLRVRGKTMWI